MDQIDALKAQGNAAYAAGAFEDAVSLYTKCDQLCEKLAWLSILAAASATRVPFAGLSTLTLQIRLSCQIEALLLLD